MTCFNWPQHLSCDSSLWPLNMDERDSISLIASYTHSNFAIQTPVHISVHFSNAFFSFLFLSFFSPNVFNVITFSKRPLRMHRGNMLGIFDFFSPTGPFAPECISNSLCWHGSLHMKPHYIEMDLKGGDIYELNSYPRGTEWGKDICLPKR